jgi:aminoglycoside phosphotransferase (APT) family kinase protein
MKMHSDELDIDAGLVARLVRSQFHEWAALPLVPVEPSGTDHAMYRLGDERVVRLPRRAQTVAHVERDRQWLPWLANQLPVPISVPLVVGAPEFGYPCAWSIYAWLPGHPVVFGEIDDMRSLVSQTAEFVQALRAIDATNGPEPTTRGISLKLTDPFVRAAIDECGDSIDRDAALVAWNATMQLPEWSGPPTWLHGDILPGNMLVDDAGRLCGIIDWGCMGVGDPVCDTEIAWNLFDAESRALYRELLGVDDDDWARGRGWALRGVLGIEYYRVTNPRFAAQARREFETALADFFAT